MKLKHKIAYMENAESWAKCSVGERLKVGAIITKSGGGIVAEGYNGLPSHMDGPLEGEDGLTKPEVRHAEKNALMKITRSNESSIGSVVFCTHTCCKPCAVDLVDAGISAYYFKQFYKNWEGIQHLLDAGVKVYKWEEDYQQFRELINIRDLRGADGISV